MSKNRFETIFGAVFFVGFVLSHLFFGAAAAVRVAGVACVVSGGVWLFRREVPVGVESRPPSFFLRGLPARLLGITMIVFGVLLLRYAGQFACMVGWSENCT